MEEFSKPIYKVDVLKVEFPATARYTEGCSVYSGQKAFTRGEALHWFRAADAAARVPYIYLSAGITISEFVDSLSLAAEAQAKYSGVLCGRANWQDGIPVYASGGKAALHKWLATEGLANVARINECLRDATPWWQRIGQTAS
jgi:tagatose 1,6-diphosphate aldolase